MIVITSAAATLRSDLLHLSPSKIQNTPVVIFSVVEDYEFVKAFLKTPLIQGYFNGYLMQEKSLLTILGRQCSVELVLSVDNPFYTRVTGAFQETGNEVKTSDNAAQAFLEQFYSSNRCLPAVGIRTKKHLQPDQGRTGKKPD